jgi:hypothetical protein
MRVKWLNINHGLLRSTIVGAAMVLEDLSIEPATREDCRDIVCAGNAQRGTVQGGLNAPRHRFRILVQIDEEEAVSSY